MSSARLKRGEVTPGGYPLGVTSSLMTSPNGVPYIDPDVVRYLKTVFAPRLDGSEDLRFYDRQVGAHNVIQHLHELVEAQSKE